MGNVTLINHLQQVVLFRKKNNVDITKKGYLRIKLHTLKTLNKEIANLH